LTDILKNMQDTADERSKLGRTDVKLSISFTMMRSNLDELEEAIKLVRYTNFDCLYTHHVEVYTPDMADESLWFDQERFNRARESAIAFARSEGIELGIPEAFEPRPPRSGHSFCMDPWSTAVILGNGDVQVCCIPGPDMRMGNLHQQSMEQIWNGPNYQRFRRLVNSPTPPDACNNCPRHRKYNNRGSFLPYEAVAASPPPSVVTS
jgi:radical SAM protein with 4Fe4S-binding SPASM domain